MSLIKLGFTLGKLAYKGLKAYKKSKVVKPVVTSTIKETKGLAKDTRNLATGILTKSKTATIAVAVPTILATHAVRMGAKKVAGSKIGKSTIKKGKSLKVKLKNWWKQQ